VPERCSQRTSVPGENPKVNGKVRRMDARVLLEGCSINTSLYLLYFCLVFESPLGLSAPSLVKTCKGLKGKGRATKRKEHNAIYRHCT